MGRHISRRAVVAGASALFGLAACGENARRRQVSLFGETMGTSYRVTLVAPPRHLDLGAFDVEIGSILGSIDERMSTYRGNSELSHFNRADASKWTPVSADTMTVVRAGLELGRHMSGAFDITVGPAVDRWGFGPSGRGQTPSVAEQGALRRRIDYRSIEVSQERGAIRKTRANAAIDLSGIAKGFAVDRLAGYISSVGVEHYLVEVGGEFRVAGLSPDDGPWTLGIEQPFSEAIGIHCMARLTGGALATSGDYRQWFERHGQRFSHIIDPRAGRPVLGDLASVSVIAHTAMQADALSTALMVLGPQDGWTCARREKIAAIFIRRGVDGFAGRATPEFERHLVG
ncbi:MAG: FAD:protein FMN transferase [Paracoccaceae bacterium]|nr:FAD:protein FMN transferase [Paracoccaceae bacterium]